MQFKIYNCLQFITKFDAEFDNDVHSYATGSTFKEVLCFTDCSLTVNNLCFHVTGVYVSMVNSVSLYQPTFMCRAELGGHEMGIKMIMFNSCSKHG